MITSATNADSKFPLKKTLTASRLIKMIAFGRVNLFVKTNAKNYTRCSIDDPLIALGNIMWIIVKMAFFYCRRS